MDGNDLGVTQLGDNLRPGDVVETGSQNWSLTLTSTSDVDRVEIIVNGQVVDVYKGVKAGKTRVLSGTLDLPEGGWVAARAYSTEWLNDPWPAMLKRAFAHSLPIWISSKGSTEPEAYASSASDLLRALDAIEQRARSAYGDRPMDKLYNRYELARQSLNSQAQ